MSKLCVYGGRHDMFLFTLTKAILAKSTVGGFKRAKNFICQNVQNFCADSDYVQKVTVQ